MGMVLSPSEEEKYRNKIIAVALPECLVHFIGCDGARKTIMLHVIAQRLIQEKKKIMKEYICSHHPSYRKLRDHLSKTKIQLHILHYDIRLLNLVYAGRVIEQCLCTSNLFVRSFVSVTLVTVTSQKGFEKLSKLT